LPRLSTNKMSNLIDKECKFINLQLWPFQRKNWLMNWLCSWQPNRFSSTDNVTFFFHCQTWNPYRRMYCNSCNLHEWTKKKLGIRGGCREYFLQNVITSFMKICHNSDCLFEFRVLFTQKQMYVTFFLTSNMSGASKDCRFAQLRSFQTL